MFRSWLHPWLLALVLAGCARDSERVFEVRGVVLAPYADGAITIRHEEIPGFMPAMTMPFNTEAADAAGLVAGDLVSFEFRVGAQSRATRFRRLGRVENRPASPAGSGDAGSPRRLRAGDPVPGFALIDQDRLPVTDADLRGRQTVVTFIFTRCPVPEFCPLMAKKFQSLQGLVAEMPAALRANVRLLSISIDPEHDRPAVLREYGGALGADFRRWRFATGSRDQIDALARAFAVRAVRDGAALDHTLATVLIGPDGRVTEIWRGNAWKPEEIADRIAPAR